MPVSSRGRWPIAATPPWRQKVWPRPWCATRQICCICEKKCIYIYTYIHTYIHTYVNINTVYIYTYLVKSSWRSASISKKKHGFLNHLNSFTTKNASQLWSSSSKILSFLGESKQLKPLHPTSPLGKSESPMAWGWTNYLKLSIWGLDLKETHRKPWICLTCVCHLKLETLNQKNHG